MSHFLTPEHADKIHNLQQHPVVEGCVRLGPLIGVPLVLREFGRDPAAVLHSVGLETDLFDDCENVISFTAMGRLLASCTAQTRCPHFGLLVGQRAGPECMGLVGQLLGCSPDVGTALRSLILHLHVHDRGAVPMLSVGPETAVMGYLIYQPDVEATDQIYDGVVAILHNTLRALCGPGFAPVAVLFARRSPADVEPYRRFFQAPLRFDQEQPGVAFPAKWLDHKLPGADPQQIKLVTDRIAALDRLEQRDLVGRLRGALPPLLMTRGASLERTAELFSLHPRTLNRRLAEAGCTFQGLVEEVRSVLACQLLGNTAMSVSQIAAALQYAETSAFTRAFRRWTGLSPTAWQAQFRQPPGV
ncbi:AraC family transcriptional regulator [Desulfovibrio sp. TomC]|uniref:AraC family transcriptional regulator n=1 Tax=Desulfovibrio sp. TomC TaxID=1562888 RepID=UPI00057572D3|nr:AraC family transcriptional regulator [Desulfovibrio sp. TomC]KHK02437.1 transcriptional regulator, AraC family [Desulfovibrio sp. TomC]